jgi:hypothetical protein
MDFKEVGCDDADWIRVSQDNYQLQTFLKTAMNFGFHKDRYFLDQLSDY